MTKREQVRLWVARHIAPIKVATIEVSLEIPQPGTRGEPVIANLGELGE